VALVLGALLAGNAAAAGTLHLAYTYESLEHKLTPGQAVEGYDYGWTIEAPEGAVSCLKAEHVEGFLGEDETNNEKTDVISSEKVFGSFYENGQCIGTIAALGSEVEGQWFNGNTDNEAAKGSFRLGTKGTGEFKSSAPLDNTIALRSVAGDFYCLYEAAKLKGPLEVGEARLTFTKDKLKALKSVLGVPSAKTCPKKVTISTTVDFYVQLGGGAEAPITGSIS
jgi:hypothetical protein